MKKPAITILIIAAVAILMTGCSSVPDGRPAPPQKDPGDRFVYRNEAAHFQKPFEYWYVTGRLETADGPMYFVSHFHKVGNTFMHSRNGYNSLRLPDGSYDYRSYGDGIIQTLAVNKLKEKIERYPKIDKYEDILAKLESGESEHFSYVPEEDRPMYQTKLFIRMNRNRLERATQSAYIYDLELDTWAGILDLEMESVSSAIDLYQENKVKVGGGSLLWNSIPWLDVNGTFEYSEVGKETEEVSGVASFNHLWGTPDPRAMYSQEFIQIRLNSGGSFLLLNFYNKDGELSNTTFVHQLPDGTIDTGKVVKTEAIDKWKSEASQKIYGTSWKLSGDFSGTVEAIYNDSEIMLEQGVGAFWIGPCSFNGAMGDSLFAPKVTGEGFCRVVGTEPRPADSVVEKIKEREDKKITDDFFKP